MDAKMKELIAVGASVSAHCQPCLTYHAGEARELGVTNEELREAIEVGKMVSKGAGAKMKAFAETVLKEEPVTPAAESEGCGCD